MRKKAFTLLLALVAIVTTAQAQVVLNETNFPDANFRKALVSKLGISEGDEITAEKIATTTSIDVSQKGIADLTGIEHFTALTELVCNGNQLTALDVSQNTALIKLYCINNQLTSLDVSKNTALEHLNCPSNRLSSLDVSKNSALKGLNCSNNRLTLLNVSDCTALTFLDCSSNLITSLDVSKNTALTYLYCHSNQLTSLDVSQNIALTRLECYNNQLTSLDVSKNTALKYLYCYSNQIKGKEMDALVASLPTVSEGFFTVVDSYLLNEQNICTTTQVAVAKEKGWKVYNYSGGFWEGSDPNIKAVVFNTENFPDAAFRAALRRQFAIRQGSEITVTGIASIISLDVSYKDIADLTGIEHFTALKELDCGGNQLTSLDVSQNTALTRLDCWVNQLTSLDVSQNTALTRLSCDGNQLASLDVSGSTALTSLSCYDNQLTSLDVSKNTALTSLSCENNQLTSLDVSKNTVLTGLDCGGNKLTSLDVSNNTELTSLICSYNQLTSLDVSQNTKLTVLWCWVNQLPSLDVSKNTALTYLYCFSNQIKGREMDALVNNLPTVKSGYFYVIDTKDENEGNVCTKSQVIVAKEKCWTVYDYFGGGSPSENSPLIRVYPEYEGSDDPEQEIDPVDEDDNVDFGNDMDENSDLDGNVIGNIYYNVGNGNGEYDADEGCVVIKKTTDDGVVNDLEGKDIFGDDFKGTFTGIVFKVPAGKGTVKVTAETTGNMLLKVKIGSNEPVEMELEGKLKISFPYNVTSESLVYIYAGTSAEAKGFGKTSATDAALKIYGIEFLRDDTPTDIDRPTPDPSLNGGESWYTIDGKKLNGEPTKPGLYIRNGKKVVK